MNFAVREKACNTYGGKGASLKSLEDVESVPQFILISSDISNAFFHEYEINTTFKSYWKAVIQGISPELLDNIRKSLIRSIMLVPLPDFIESQLKDAFNTIPGQTKIVRSSASIEDGSEHSWAGQFSSYFVSDYEQYIKAVKMCWASIATESVANYAKQTNCCAPDIAVILQQAIDGIAAGVVFSTDPTGKDDKPLLEATWGLGGPLVSGLVTPERWSMVDDRSYCIQSRGTGPVTLHPYNRDIVPGSSYLLPTFNGESIEVRAIGYKTKEGAWIGNPIITQTTKPSVLSEKQVLKIMNFSISRSKENDKAMELEWVIDREGHIWWVQERPITVTNTKKSIQANIHDDSIKAIGTTGSEGVVSGPGWWQDDNKPLCNEQRPILFKKTTTPADVPLLLEIGGLTTLDGGILSHSAIVSRELEIPCIIGTNPFPPQISVDGTILLDATSGEIRKVDDKNYVVKKNPLPSIMTLETPSNIEDDTHINWWCGKNISSRIEPDVKYKLQRVSTLPGVIGAVNVLTDIKKPHEHLGFPIGITFRSERFHPNAVSDCGDGFRACKIEGIKPNEIIENAKEIIKTIKKWLGQDSIEGYKIQQEISLSDVFSKGIKSLNNTKWQEQYPELVDSDGCFYGGSIDGLDDDLKQLAKYCLGWHGESGHFLEFLTPAKSLQSSEYDSDCTPMILFHTGSVELGIEFLRRTFPRGVSASEQEGLDDPNSRSLGLWGLDITNRIGRTALANAIGLVNYSFVRRLILQHLIEKALTEVFKRSCKLILVSDVVHTAVQKDGDALLHRQGVQSICSTNDSVPLIISGAPQVASYQVLPKKFSPTNWCSHGKVYAGHNVNLKRDNIAKSIAEKTVLIGPSDTDIITADAQTLEAVKTLESSGVVQPQKMLLPLICLRGTRNGRSKITRK